MQISTFRVENLSFEGTELGLKRQLEGYPGIECVSVDPVSRIVTVRHDETVLSGRAIRRALADCGYWSPDCEIDGAERRAAANETSGSSTGR